jgi:hypothetical protein
VTLPSARALWRRSHHSASSVAIFTWYSDMPQVWTISGHSDGQSVATSSQVTALPTRAGRPSRRPRHEWSSTPVQVRRLVGGPGCQLHVN